MNSSQILAYTTFAYLATSFLYLAGVTFRSPKALRAASWTALAAVIINVAGILLRWKESYDLGYGHAPLSNLYESLVFGAACVMGIYLVMEKKTGHRALGVVPSLLAFLAMAYASFSPDVSSRIQPLLPALKSNWLIAHVITCFLGYAAFAISFAISLVYLWQRRRHEAGHASGRLGFIPGVRELDEYNYQVILFGFLWLSVGIITGSVWANSAWGSYWSWDPKETWSLITWLIYAAVLHARVVRGWQGPRVAWLSMAGFCSVLFTYFGVNFLLSGLHSYATK
ncbi:cytochrome c-type biogenesis protein CcsB [Desulfacinum hydrothermale DSM 13146]|uniref:Heme exporter protein C n=1 Tax=Desulfacinum hydrothermale DSM 13146 TaxID=1121390 RepID=A0A1W1X7U3_9BACT|nr:c-type cytochrome biogenesis protein CcsB [Desulfacinum hydrothermale]SMC19976.1 cytochrome c-type biogenesis protein CcsB [Desulfacinum hydrothermale DSM 13146]